ncbi:MAG: hypothetical protein K6G00_09840 [Treponema sp.]|nr:hypothetical protein [Treponema sp.]
MEKERDLFFKEFEEKVNEKVSSLELAEFRADSPIYKELNLNTYRPSIWGLLVFCEKNVYYYVAPQESYMSFFTKGAGRTEEKLLHISEFSDIKFSLPQKNFFSFLNPEISRSILMSYKNISGIERNVTLILNRKAEEVFLQLKAYTESN